MRQSSGLARRSFVLASLRANVMSVAIQGGRGESRQSLAAFCLWIASVIALRLTSQ